MWSQLGGGIKQGMENFVIQAQFGSLGLGYFMNIFFYIFFKSHSTKRVASTIELCKQRQVAMLVWEQNDH